MPFTGPTPWPLRQALNYALRTTILSDAVPAINASLSAAMTGNTVNTGTIPQFGDATVRVGDLLAVGAPVICLVSGGEDAGIDAMGEYFYKLRTKVRVKTPWAGDSEPEDIAAFESCVADNLRDFLTSSDSITVTPTNPVTGAFKLPGGLSFINCLYGGYKVFPFPIKSADGVTRCYGFEMYHSADIQLTIDRSPAIGV